MLRLWIEEGIEEAEEEMKKKPQQKETETTGCACGRAVCCGKHKNGQCACQKQGRERD